MKTVLLILSLVFSFAALLLLFRSGSRHDPQRLAEDNYRNRMISRYK